MIIVLPLKRFVSKKLVHSISCEVIRFFVLGYYITTFLNSLRNMVGYTL